MVVILLGASASGKTYVENYLKQERGFTSLVSATTRLRRQGETNGEVYNFVSPEEFAKLDLANKIDKGPYLQYGVEKKTIQNLSGKNVVYSCINAEPVKKLIEEISSNEEIKIVLFNIPENIRKKHILKRGNISSKELKLRLHWDDWDYIQKNLNIAAEITNQKESLNAIKELLK